MVGKQDQGHAVGPGADRRAHLAAAAFHGDTFADPNPAHRHIAPFHCAHLDAGAHANCFRNIHTASCVAHADGDLDANARAYRQARKGCGWNQRGSSDATALSAFIQVKVVASDARCT